MNKGNKTNVLSILDIKDEIEDIIDLGIKLKDEAKKGKKQDYLKNKTLGMIFERASLRTRVSFEVGMKLLGGQTIFLRKDDINISQRESSEDIAKVLSRYVDIIVYRSIERKNLEELAKYATVPVINGLDKLEHPCQILADLMTIKEYKDRLNGLNFVFIGDGDDNLVHSYLLGCTLVGMNVTIISPKKYWPSKYFVDNAKKIAKKKNLRLTLTEDINSVKDADVVATDTWVSLWYEKERQERIKDFNGYMITQKVMKRAKDAIFLHCMPIYYEEEVTKRVAHGPQSVIIDEAENHMWAQMALIIMLLQAVSSKKEQYNII
jgi:ornithine carbamoyltransferase